MAGGVAARHRGAGQLDPSADRPGAGRLLPLRPRPHRGPPAGAVVLLPQAGGRLRRPAPDPGPARAAGRDRSADGQPGPAGAPGGRLGLGHPGADHGHAGAAGVTIRGLAHTGVAVADVEAAVAWYERVLGLTVLSPPYLMEGAALDADMGELLAGRPVAIKAAILGFADGD